MTRHPIAGAAALILTAACSASGAAHSDTVGGSLTAGGYIQEFDSDGTIDSRQLMGPGAVSIGRASVEIETAPGGAVLVKTPTPTSAGSFYASGFVSYYADLVGPDAAMVPLRLYYHLLAKSTIGGSLSSAEVVFGNTFFNAKSYNGATTPNYNGYLLQSASTGSPIKITIGASSEYGGFGYADPLLEIDPDWAAAHPTLAGRLSLTFSDGVDNGFGDLAPGVPEPASWAMMLVGFGLAGAALRRRAWTTSGLSQA